MHTNARERHSLTVAVRLPKEADFRLVLFEGLTLPGGSGFGAKEGALDGAEDPGSRPAQGLSPRSESDVAPDGLGER